MPPNLASRLAIGAALSVLLLAGPGVTGPFDSATNQGPSSSQTPYLVPVIPGARSTSLLTVGDSVPRDGGGDPYRMVGIPDGIGAFDNGNGTITVLMNHEIPAANGVPRGSGGTGAFVSKWTVDKNSLQVLSGRDLVTTPANLHVESGSINLDRLCSADLPALSAFYNAATGLGYNGRIYMNGEERTGTGRAFGWVVAENAAYELPKLGKFAHENEVASPHSGNTTLVMGMDDTRGPSDTAGGKIWAYVGTKTDTGSAIDKAGLTNGQSYAIAVQGATSEDRTGDIGVGKDGSKQFTLVDPSTGTNFLRPEDGAWDTKDPNRFYFVTTDRYDETKDGVGTQIGRSRLWSITFDDVTDPLKGGKIELLLDGTEPQQMFDNITVDAAGNVYLQEDPGNQVHNAKIWIYNPNTGADRDLQARCGALRRYRSAADTAVQPGRGNLGDHRRHRSLPGRELVSWRQDLPSRRAGALPDPGRTGRRRAVAAAAGCAGARLGRADPFCPCRLQTAAAPPQRDAACLGCSLGSCEGHCRPPSFLGGGRDKGGVVRFGNAGLLVGLFGLGLFSMTPAGAVPSISVADAVSICEAGFPPPGGQSASTARRGTCIALIDGVVGTVAQLAAMAETARTSPAGSSDSTTAGGRAGLFCIPPTEPYEKLSEVFIRFARANPQHNERAAASILVASLAAAYPCARN
jgi:hypothetical protein